MGLHVPKNGANTLIMFATAAFGLLAGCHKTPPPAPPPPTITGGRITPETGSPQGWKTVVPEDKGFAVFMPDTPVKEHTQVKTASGPAEKTVYSTKSEGVLYRVGVIQYPNKKLTSAGADAVDPSGGRPPCAQSLR